MAAMIIAFMLLIFLFFVLRCRLNLFTGIVLIDLVLRLVTLTFGDFNNNIVFKTLDDWLPESLHAIINEYTSSTLNQVLFVFYILCYAVFAYLILERIYYKLKRR